jgi:hypothetical protein
MGLKFLQKKKWHPQTIENLEAVWLAEQKHKEMKNQVKEYQKRIEEERKDEELKRAQVKAGLIPESDLKKMTWMYDVPSVAQNKPSNTLDDFFDTDHVDPFKESEDDRLRRESKDIKDRILWWVINNPRDVKRMVKDYRKNKDESALNSQFFNMIEDILDKKHRSKKKKKDKNKKSGKKHKKAKSK